MGMQFRDGEVDRHRVVLDVAAVAPPGVRHVVGDVVVGAARRRDGVGAPIVLVCLPGGGMSRAYFDLRVDGTGDEYSMAAYLASRGVIVVTLDHPGVGESDVPDDGYTLTPRTVAAVNADACTQLLAGLRTGALVASLAPMPTLRSVGCGHSMGGLLTAHQQANHRTHDALALLGFGGGGLLEHLTDDEKAYAGDALRTAGDIAQLASRRFGRPLSRGSTGASPFLLAVPVADEAIAAITRSGSNLLNLCGLFSMIPGASRPELEAVDVPVFLGVGAFDITGDAHLIPGQFTGSRDVTLFVCPGSGHNHNVAPTRTDLWDRLLVWLRQIADAGTREEPHAGSS